jgi:hypothetical protein
VGTNLELRYSLVALAVSVFGVIPPPALGASRVKPVSGAIVLNQARSDVTPELDSATRSRLVRLTGDRLLFVWLNRHSDDDNTRRDLWVRTFNSNLAPLSDGYRLLELPIFGQDDTGISGEEITADKNDSVSLVFTNVSGRDGDSGGIYGWKFSDAGEELVAPYLVNTTSVGSQDSPRIAMTSSGDSVIAWQSQILDPFEDAVRLQRFREGTASGEEVKATYSQMEFSTGGEVIATSDGLYAAWIDLLLQDQSSGLWGAITISRFEPTLEEWDMPFDAKLTVVGASPVHKCCLSGAALSDERILLIWSENNAPEPGSIIRARLLPSSLEATEAELSHVVSSVGGVVIDPRVAAAPTGQHAIVVWEELIGGQLSRAHGIVLDGTGRPVGDSFPLGAFVEGNQLAPIAVHTSDHEFVVTWTEHATNMSGSPTRVRAQKFRIGSLVSVCGDATDDGFLASSDALVTLKAAVGNSSARCKLCLCDTDQSATVSVADALAILRVSAGLAASLQCPACS